MHLTYARLNYCVLFSPELNASRLHIFYCAANVRCDRANFSIRHHTTPTKYLGYLSELRQHFVMGNRLVEVDGRRPIQFDISYKRLPPYNVCTCSMRLVRRDSLGKDTYSDHLASLMW